jgi:hypothetical protein
MGLTDALDLFDRAADLIGKDEYEVDTPSASGHTER